MRKRLQNNIQRRRRLHNLLRRLLQQDGNLKTEITHHLIKTPTCKNCSTTFEITDQDLAFYAKMSVPPPTFCPDCRRQRRLSFRNERNLYNRTCDLCKKTMISTFPQDSKYKVYCSSCWWSDAWDPLKYGQDFDFNKPFFEQFDKLLREVPMMNLITDQQSLVNSEYVNYVSDAKNCYLVFASNFLEDCMYSSYIWESKDSSDCSYSTGLELCYECIDCDKMFNCNYLQNSEGCSDCVLGFGLKNCIECFGCVNLLHKKYFFFNEQLDKEEYGKKVNEITKNPEKFAAAKRKFQEFSLKFPRKFANQIKCENSIGDAIKNCKNAFNCFDGYGAEDVKWIDNFPGELKDCYDLSGTAKTELGIDSVCVGLPSYFTRYCIVALESSYCDYCAFVKGCKHCSGCAGLSRNEYCILNKKYSKEEYERLTGLIINHMKKTGEWGEFFPTELSPFKYEETVANDYYPNHP